MFEHEEKMKKQPVGTFANSKSNSRFGLHNKTTMKKLHELYADAVSLNQNIDQLKISGESASLERALQLSDDLSLELGRVWAR